MPPKTTPPVIFDIAYTPYRLKSNATAEEVEKHRQSRAYYDMSATDSNIYKYITTDGKIVGSHAKRFTMLEYLQKSTGVFNGDGVISKREVKEMKARAQDGEKNIWHGYISFDEAHSEEIDHPEKCIKLVKQMFPQFFKDMGLDKDNVDLMCALHLDKPKHLHIHYVFWERAPKIKNKRAAGYTYRKKGKVPLDVIERMTERLNAWAITDDLSKKRDVAIGTLKDWDKFLSEHYKDKATEALKALAEKLPKTGRLMYASKEMAPFRDEIDEAVRLVAGTDSAVGKADSEFREELFHKTCQLTPIMGKWHREQLKNDQDFNMQHEPFASDDGKVNYINTPQRIWWDYRRRMGNVILAKVRYIQDHSYTYDRTKKHKSNDKRLKRNISVSNSIISRSLDALFNSVASLFMPEITSHRNRLHEIEEEIKEEKEKEEQAAIITRKRNYNEGK